MLSLLALSIAAAAAGPAPAAVAPQRQAAAMVRIVRASVIRFKDGEVSSGDGTAQATRTFVTAADGTSQPAKLLEFE